MNTRNAMGFTCSCARAWSALAAALFLSAVAFLPARAADAERKPLRILFVGNSYTTVNNLPGLVKTLLASRGRQVDVALYAAGGATLRDHWHHNAGLEPPRPGVGPKPSRKGGLDRLLREKGPWDYVVLQGQSQETLGGKPCEFDAYAEKLVGLIRKAQPDAVPVFYLTWARQHIPDQQPAITKAYVGAARATRSRVAPAGEAWQAAIAAREGLALHAKDRSHPSLLGTYLTACVFCAVFTGESPVGLPGVPDAPSPKGKSGESGSDDAAAFLQAIAWKIVQAMPEETGVARRKQGAERP